MNLEQKRQAPTSKTKSSAPAPRSGDSKWTIYLSWLSTEGGDSEWRPRSFYRGPQQKVETASGDPGEFGVNRFSFTGECNHPEAVIRSCQEPGNQFLIANQKFTIAYKKCPGIKESVEGVTEFSCLGDWLDGKNHYFAVANNKESRKEEKYRCFIRNRDDDLYMGASITPECSVLDTPENSPARFRMTPVKHDNVQPSCLLPQNFTGHWINTAHTEADIIINQTHITEISYPDIGRYRKTVYVCKERRDNRFMMARLNIDGCQTDFVCFDFIPRHHNVIRFRKGLEMIIEQFSTVCSYIQFKSGRDWSYDLLLAKDPVPVQCPVAGMFNFSQSGDELLTTRLLGGPTSEPWDGIYCKQNISVFSVCDLEQKEIWIDAVKCITVNAYGQEVDIYTLPDYKLKCIGYWKENLKSYLITFDERDPVSRYRCWVYQRADLNRILLSQSVGPSCNLQQTVHARSIREGAAVSLSLVEYEREHDRCPMRFDDGADPWKADKTQVIVFNVQAGAGSVGYSAVLLLLSAAAILL
ncbi:uncharacterized protein LOC108670080 [Hyalella azteca]|uniref:Uncharacterized protein LOC108670080 n=1 Tax=Hyalella azteca TaxID=294128 RepID=A0A8B7NI36_HYAAZ|nr:uncharacterized protein LOC108670080 [Hyalella azteca]